MADMPILQKNYISTTHLNVVDNPTYLGNVVFRNEANLVQRLHPREDPMKSQLGEHVAVVRRIPSNFQRFESKGLQDQVQVRMHLYTNIFLEKGGLLSFALHAC